MDQHSPLGIQIFGFFSFFPRFDKKQDETGKLIDCFEWKNQLKYNWDESSNNLKVKLLDAEFDYGFEYQGSAARLAFLPGTEKMYYSMASTIKSHTAAMCVGSNLSGRVESARELSRIVGQPLYVFNCTKTMDVLMLVDIFRGLASTGSWVCFNNLAHIVPGALSVLCELLQTYLEALRAKRPHITYAALGEEIALNPLGACFATLDSALDAPSMSNIDRHLVLNSTMSMLPSDLTGLFRTVSITSPDFRISMEIILLSQGFRQAAELSSRLASLREMYIKIIPMGLTVNNDNKLRNAAYEGPHGWSIRNMRNIITEAGILLDELQANYMEEEYQTALAELVSIENRDPLQLVAEEEQSEEKEDEKQTEKGSFELPETLAKYEIEAIVSALRNTFMPRLHGSDADMFVTMVTDVFPDTPVDMGFGGVDPSIGKKSDVISLNTPVVSTQGPSKVIQSYLPNTGGEKQYLEDINSAIAVATNELGLLPGTSFQARVAQLCQLTNTHQTVIVTGPPGCGKSECIKTLMSAQRETGKIVTTHRIFLQAVESVELLGSADPETK
nr:dynein heavy chain, cytoplasmic-like [Lytechinus pictus]